MESFLEFCCYILLHSTVDYIQHFNPAQLFTVFIKDCSIAKSVEIPAQYRSDILVV